MTKAQQCTLIEIRTIRRACAIAGLLAASLVCRPAKAQDSSLGDLARQTRAQKATTAGNTRAQELVDQMEQEQEASGNAPTGFKDYNAGDYHIFVPFPYELEGRDQRGTVLAGSRLGVTNTEVMLGAPQPIPGNLSDDELFHYVRQIALQLAGGGSCSPLKVGERRAYRCSLGRARLLDHEVWGTMAVVIGSSSAIPVMCVSPDEMNEHLVYGNPRASYQEKQAAYAKQSQRFRDEQTTFQICDQVVYPSIRLKEDFLPPSAVAKIGDAAAKPKPHALDAVPSSVAAPAQSVEAGKALPPVSTPSVADIARQKRQASLDQVKAKVAIDASGDAGLAPAGFKTLTFSYCQKKLCWTGSAFIPSGARELNTYYSEYIYELPIGNEKSPEKVLLFVGPAALYGMNRLSTEPNLILWEEISDPEGWDIKGRLLEITHDEGTIDGRPAAMAHFELNKNNAVWIGRSAKVSSHEIEVLAGCLVPKNRFGDADRLCSTVIDSLRLP